MYLQAASEVKTFAPAVIRYQHPDRYNFIFRRDSTVRELRPEAIGGNGYIHFAEFSQFISNVGRVYAAALSELDIVDRLHKDTLVPASDRGAEFPNDISREIVYIKADTVRKSLAKL